MVFWKKILWLAVIGGVAYGGYAAYGKWGKTDVQREAVDLGKGIVGYVRTAASSTLGTVKGAAKTYATQVVGETEQTLLSAAKEKVGNLLAPLGEKLSSFAGTLSGTPAGEVGKAVSVPQATGTAFSVPPPPAAIVARPNAPFSISVSGISRYTVDWGDGIKEAGDVPEDRATLLSHAWATAGDYTVHMEVKENGAIHSYTFPIRVNVQ